MTAPMAPEESADIVESLRERAKAAREENTGTADGDAIHFEEAAREIEGLRLWQRARLETGDLHLEEIVRLEAEIERLRGGLAQSPRLGREGIEHARFMKLAQYDDTIAKAKDDGALSDTGREIIIDPCLASKSAVAAFADAVLALLSPPGPMVPWELDCQRKICAAPVCECPVVTSTSHLEGCPSGDFGPCDCQVAPSNLRGEPK